MQTREKLRNLCVIHYLHQLYNEWQHKLLDLIRVRMFIPNTTNHFKRPYFFSKQTNKILFFVACNMWSMNIKKRKVWCYLQLASDKILRFNVVSIPITFHDTVLTLELTQLRFSWKVKRKQRIYCNHKVNIHLWYMYKA